MMKEVKMSFLDAEAVPGILKKINNVASRMYIMPMINVSDMRKIFNDETKKFEPLEQQITVIGFFFEDEKWIYDELEKIREEEAG